MSDLEIFPKSSNTESVISDIDNLQLRVISSCFDSHFAFDWRLNAFSFQWYFLGYFLFGLHNQLQVEGLNLNRSECDPKINLRIARDRPALEI